jgi:hypothetical protein
MTRYILRLLSILLGIAALTLFSQVVSAGQIYIHNVAKGAITCDLAGNLSNQFKHNTQAIANQKANFPNSISNSKKIAMYHVKNSQVFPKLW